MTVSPGELDFWLVTSFFVLSLIARRWFHNLAHVCRNIWVLMMTPTTTAKTYIIRTMLMTTMTMMMMIMMMMTMMMTLFS